METPREMQLWLSERTHLKNNLISFKLDAARNEASGWEVMNNGEMSGTLGPQNFLPLHVWHWEFIIHVLISHPGLFVGGLMTN